MTVGEALNTFGEMVCATSSSLNDIINLVVGTQKVPKIINRCVLVINGVERCSREGSDGIVGASTDDVLVVSVVLGEGLLDDGTPEALILRDCGKEGVPAISPLSKRQVVIDDDRVRQTEGEEVHSVDTVATDLVVRVDENLLHAAWNFSENGGTRDEPAVADKALTHVFVLDASGTEKSVSVVIDIRDSRPSDHGGSL